MNAQPSRVRPVLRLVPSPTPADRPWRPPGSLRVTHRDEGAVWVMTLAGEADLTTREELDRGLTLALSAAADVLVVDVAELEFCDSLCATAVIEANCNAPDTQLVLTGGHGMISRVFDLLDPAQTLARHG